MHARETMVINVIPEYPFQVVGTNLFASNGQEYITLVVIIRELKVIVSRYGIPELIRDDNGPQYSSKLFGSFSNE